MVDSSIVQAFPNTLTLELDSATLLELFTFSLLELFTFSLELETFSLLELFAFSLLELFTFSLELETFSLLDDSEVCSSAEEVSAGAATELESSHAVNASEVITDMHATFSNVFPKRYFISTPLKK
ncbi:hypothetical protein B7989_01610 [Fibrobacter sp. UWB5]|nr:hypothetical protein B7989_01610 [Fibrobacter sp. UWB5]